jgi:hypothetical protein
MIRNAQFLGQALQNSSIVSMDFMITVTTRNIAPIEKNFWKNGALDLFMSMSFIASFFFFSMYLIASIYYNILQEA